MPAIVRAGLDWSQESRTPFRSVMWLPGTQRLGLSSASQEGPLAGNKPEAEAELEPKHSDADYGHLKQ